MKVTIVGAGVVGCAIAFELASRGATVQVVESRGVGMGATRASAGILAPRIEGHSEALLRLGLCSLGIYDDFVARVRAGSDTTLEYERTGTLQVALGLDELDALRASSLQLRALGVEHTLVDAAREIAALEPSLSQGAAGGLLLPAHGYIVPDAFVQSLAEAATRRGAVFVNGRVESVSGDERRAEIVTSDGRTTADAVIVAGGSWASGLIAASRPLVKPIRGQLLHLRTERRLASRVIWGSRCYLVPRADGSVLAGATVEDVGFDETATAAGVRGLLEAAADLLPELAGARFDEVRVGLRPMTVDELPVIGPSSIMPRVVHAFGHYRNGVLLAPLTAVMVADLVLEGRARPELALTRPDRLGL